MSRAPKVCSSPSCPNLQPCPDHERKPWASSTRRAELPPGWSSRIVPRILARDPICTDGRSCGGLALSREVHHVGSKFDHSDANLAGVCRACHRAATAEQAAAGRRR